MEKVRITFENGDVLEYPKGISLMDIVKERHPHSPYPIIGALVNNAVNDLWLEIDRDCSVKFIDICHPDGFRMMVRGYTMLLVKAVRDVYPHREIKVLHSLSKGLYCRWADGTPVRREEIKRIEKRMRELVNLDIKFERSEITKEEGIKIFQEEGLLDKVRLLKFRRKKRMKVYTCDGYTNYFFGRLPPSTGVLDKFEIRLYPPGFILRYPTNTHPSGIPPYEEQKKLATVYSEYKEWAEILGVSDVASLNAIISRGEVTDLIRVMEAFHEKKIAGIADVITQRANKIKIVLIAGPSASGKTTFAQRLKIQLRVNGMHPVTISLDDYFVDKEKTPKDEKGNYDFEHVEAIDISLFNDHLERLLFGEEVAVPKYDFKKGKRIESDRKLKLTEKSIVIIEGIHGLNPILTETVPSENKYKIYVSALTMLNLDNHNRIPTTDTRIIRRIVRDNNSRGHTALDTIYMWPSVRRGEERFIFPYQEEADIMFNSALIYELAVLKGYVEPLLVDIPSSEPAYAEAKRLLSFTDNFLDIGAGEVPPTSILREFIEPTYNFRMGVI